MGHCDRLLSPSSLCLRRSFQAKTSYIYSTLEDFQEETRIQLLSLGLGLMLTLYTQLLSVLSLSNTASLKLCQNLPFLES